METILLVLIGIILAACFIMICKCEREIGKCDGWLECFEEISNPYRELIESYEESRKNLKEYIETLQKSSDYKDKKIKLLEDANKKMERKLNECYKSA